MSTLRSVLYKRDVNICQKRGLSVSKERCIHVKREACFGVQNHLHRDVLQELDPLKEPMLRARWEAYSAKETCICVKREVYLCVKKKCIHVKIEVHPCQKRDVSMSKRDVYPCQKKWFIHVQIEVY